MPSFLYNPDPVDMILLPNQLLGGDHQLVHVSNDTAGSADSDAEVP